MVSWFKEKAPIRRKFTALLCIHGSLAAIVAAAVFASIQTSISPVAALGMAIGSLIAHIAVVLVAKKLICDPFVETVVRMEGLADGDLASPGGVP